MVTLFLLSCSLTPAPAGEPPERPPVVRPAPAPDPARWRAATATSKGPLHRLHYPEGHFDEAQLERIHAHLGAARARFLSLLEVQKGPRERFDVWVYPDRDTKEAMTGSRRTGHAHGKRGVFHLIDGKRALTVGPHEDAHLVAWAVWGPPKQPMIREGIAAWAAEPWMRKPLAKQAAALLQRDQLPALASMFDDFMETKPLPAGYTAAGHFVAFVAERWDVATLKQLYACDDLASASQRVLGMSVSRLEREWHGHIPVDPASQVRSVQR